MDEKKLQEKMKEIFEVPSSDEKDFQKIKEDFPVGQKVELTRDWKKMKKGQSGEVIGHFPPPACLVTVRFGNNVSPMDLMSINAEEIKSSLIAKVS